MRADDTVLLNARTPEPVPVGRMGFGAAPLGNPLRGLSEEEAQSTLRAAYACGLRFFDTAPLYGLGHSERRLGLGIRGFGRENIVLSTKVGRLIVDGPAEEAAPRAGGSRRRAVFDYGYDGVMRSLESSLARLGVEAVDILLVHDVDAFTHGGRDASDARLRELFDGGGYRALAELRASGRIKAFGAGVNEWQVCRTLLDRGEFDAFLLAGRYTLLEQGGLESLLPLCLERDVGIILGGPYNSGILASGPVEGATYDYKPAPPGILERVGRIQALCEIHGVRLAAAALQFVLAHPAVKTVIPGAASAAEVRENVGLLGASVPPGLWSDLKAAGLVRDDAPVPAP